MHSLTLPGARARRTRLAALLAACCAIASLPAAHAEDTSTFDEAAYLSQRYVQPTLAFAPCTEAPALECATLPVPIDYRKPWNGTVGLVVIRAKATQPSRRLGVLFANPGGPGGSGVDFIRQGVNAPLFIRLRERFDIVSFDVRGSHRSRAVTCTLPPSADAENVPAPQLTAFFDNTSRAIARTCLEQAGPFLTTLSANNIARDVDVLRRSLGERQITYVGQSWGTVLGAVYASLFPQHVRALLLDANAQAHYRDGKTEFRMEQSASFEMVFQHVDQLCRADPGCRLRGVGLATAQDELLARLKTQPLTAPSGRVLDPRSERALLGLLLSVESLWPLMVDAVADARAGNPSLILAALDAFEVGGPVGAPPQLTAFSAILCNDFGTRRPAAEYLPVSEAVAPLYRRLENRFAVADSVALCASWPESDVPLIRSLRGRLSVPALLLGGHFDPNTPLAWTRNMAATLGMERSVVRYQGGGHTTFIAVPCMTRVGEAYLYELKLPEEGFSCAAKPVPFTPGAVAAQLQVLRDTAAFVRARAPDARQRD